MHISFVILHYVTLNDTIECVESIISNIDYENYDIIIVDNGSPNNSGSELEKLYSTNTKVHFIKNLENLGFAKGNNVGFRYAKYELKSDFIVMINNDTVIKQENFCRKLVEKFLTESYDICGPNIVSLVDNNKQNPVPKIFSNVRQVNKMKRKFKVLLAMNYIGLDNVIEKLLLLKNKKTSEKSNIKSDDMQLHGSCLIFSPSYIKKYDGLFDKTFMYIEECILKYIAERDNLKMLYYDKITIYHKEDSATNAYLNNGYKKRRFYYKNSINSCEVLESLMNSKIGG